MAKREKQRNEIEEKYKWDLSVIYKDDKAVEEDIKRCERLLEKANLW